MAVGIPIGNAADLAKSEAVFHQSFGRAMANWATLEQRLFFWFHAVTGMPEAMSRAIFYSARNFNGRSEMLEAAIKASSIKPEYAEFIQSAIKKSVQFNKFRNTIAHGEPAFLYSDRQTTEPVLSRGALGALAKAEHVIGIKQLTVAAGNFQVLSTAVMDGLELLYGMTDHSSPSLPACLARVRALPSQADSEASSRKREKPVRPHRL